MKRLLCSWVLGMVLCGCTRHSVEERRMYRDPLTGADTVMRVVHLDDVEVTAAEFAPSAMTIVSVGGAPVAGITCSVPKLCEVQVFDGKGIGATIHVSRDGGKPMAVEYVGTGWYVWDHNGSGQIDTRVAHNSKAAEIWIDGTWKERHSIGAGKERRFYIGDREVILTPSGWKYVGT